MLKQNVIDAKNSLERYDFPRDVVIETSAFCNLNCVMCPQGKMERERGYMKLDVFKKIVDEVSWESPDTRIWIAIMGEALLNPHIVDMVRYATDFGLHVYFNTNAMLLNKDMADRLIDENVHQFLIGLDATTEEVYKKIRRGGDFDTVVENAKYLIGKTDVLMQFIEMEENQHQTEEFIDYWTGLGARVKARPRLGWGPGVSADNLIVPESERFPCPWLLRTVSIHWNGKMAQCDGDYEGGYSPGDVNEQTIKAVWEGELAKRRERHWNHDFTFPSCQKCKDWQAGRSYYYG